DPEVTTEKNKQEREQARLDSLKLTKQIERMSEMHDQISDLEEQLRSRIDGIKELRAQLSASQDQLSQSMQIVAEEQRRTRKRQELLDWISSSHSWQLIASPRPWTFWEKVRFRREVLYGALDL